MEQTTLSSGRDQGLFNVYFVDIDEERRVDLKRERARGSVNNNICKGLACPNTFRLRAVAVRLDRRQGRDLSLLNFQMLMFREELSITSISTLEQRKGLQQRSRRMLERNCLQAHLQIYEQVVAHSRHQVESP